jgi:plasmid stability protein
MGEDTERVAAEVSSDLKTEIRVAAARRDTSMAAVIRETLCDKFGPESDDSSEENEKKGMAVRCSAES